jgi:hypothetical protein
LAGLLIPEADAMSTAPRRQAIFGYFDQYVFEQKILAIMLCSDSKSQKCLALFGE